MWPFDLPAREALRLPGETSIAWAVFDKDWYRSAYPDAVSSLPDQSGPGLLTFYLDRGQRMGHSPNRFFDESWHRRAYPNIANAIRERRFSSAFDAYCRVGNIDRSPHWLFDERFYRRRYPDLTDDILVGAGLANGYDHYLRHGDKEGRIGHLLFDPRFYLENVDPEARESARETGPFRDYLLGLEQRRAECETSRYFSSSWYIRRYPAVAEMIARGEWRSALEHYLCNDTPTAFDPLPDFSEDWYLTGHPGLREAIGSGAHRNGYAHFLQYGTVELRSPAPDVDLRWYAARDSVRESLLLREADDAFDHWLRIGKPDGQRAAPPPEEQINDAQARTLFREYATALLPVLGRAPLRFGYAGDPAISAVMVVGDDLDGSLATLSSLRNNTADAIDLILIVLGPEPDVREIDRFVTGATIQRFGEDIGLVTGFEVGLACAQADAVICLATGSEFAPGAIDAALRRLRSDPGIGAVGAKVLRPSGLIRSAGHVVWRNGRSHAYMGGASPLAPEVNFTRDVHFCGSAFLLLRAAPLAELRDTGVAPPIDDDAAADLCLRLAAAGYRVVYDPAVMIRHWDDQDPTRNARVDTAAHADFLATCHESDGPILVAARSADPSQHRVLFIEDTVPLRSIGSGFVRANDLIRTMAGLGFAVTVFPVNGCRFGVASVYADMPDSVEVMTDQTLSRLTEFLRLRQGLYDTIWVSRTHNLDLVRPILERALEEQAIPPAIVLDTEAIGAVRSAALAELEGRDFDLDAAVRREFANADICRAIIAVGEAEATMLRGLGYPDVRVIGHVRALTPTERPFAQRAGMLFTGAIHRMDSPNYDSLCWFVDSVLPLVERSLGWETRLTIAGFTAPDVTLERFADHPRVTLRGAVTNLEPLYAAHRLFVAPTRFAAGVPYKVHEAASFGLPVVATELLSRQLGWTDGQELLAADPRDPVAFAARIVALYRDEALWTRLRTAALVRLALDNHAADYDASVSAVLGPSRRAATLGRRKTDQ